ncbi:SRPBCC family protein [Stenotrophobium rhamnosiphilum]|uniref:SRPBCC family protein n=1 Tax=Stenotrophobium rhamnosiphilum TaxID=2029166 RepID=A0A2T5MGM1_9GAMM|nr:SRPBCC family protein [Stenotrophobium rhamnosiphilum]PTU31735.1 SRPBCC family protein [Stenotrophobium rhamnosiphilum]
MQTIVVKRTIKAPIEKVFDMLSDHANYKDFPGVKDSELVKKGKPHKNGVGAVREIDAGTAWFREEITAYERPVRLDYLITKSRPPMEHKGGSVRLEATAAGTEVTWSSTLRIRIPLIGGLVTKLVAPQLAKAFAGTLKSVEKRLA